jgi:hypothetical protein
MNWSYSQKDLGVLTFRLVFTTHIAQPPFPKNIPEISYITYITMINRQEDVICCCCLTAPKHTDFMPLWAPNSFLLGLT